MTMGYDNMLGLPWSGWTNSTRTHTRSTSRQSYGNLWLLCKRHVSNTVFETQTVSSRINFCHIFHQNILGQVSGFYSEDFLYKSSILLIYTNFTLLYLEPDCNVEFQWKLQFSFWYVSKNWSALQWPVGWTWLGNELMAQSLWPTFSCLSLQRQWHKPSILCSSLCQPPQHTHSHALLQVRLLHFCF